MDQHQVRRLEKENKAKALKEYQSKLEKAGHEVLNVEYQGVRQRDAAAKGHVYQNDLETFIGESSMYQALYGKPERDSLEGLLNANKKVIQTNGVTAGLLKDQVNKNEEKAYKKSMLDMELAKKKAQLEKEKMEIDIMKANAQKEKRPIESKMMFNAMSSLTDTMGVMHDNYANLLKGVMDVFYSNEESVPKSYNCPSKYIFTSDDAGWKRCGPTTR